MKEKFEIVVYCVVGLLLALAICTLGYQEIHKQQALADAIKAGADPIAARCAFDGPGSSGWSAECVRAALRGGAK